MRPWHFLMIVLTATTLLVAGCGGDNGSGGGAGGGKPVVVATIFSYYDAARAIAGDKADVALILPPNKSPHDYQTTPRDKTTVYGAKLYIKNGMDLDDRFDGLLEGSKAKVLEIGKVIDPKAIVQTEETSLDDAPKEPARAANNPHIWLDPKVQMAAAEKIRDALIDIDPADTATFKTNAGKYLESLNKLDADFAAAAKQFKTRQFIGFHSAYDYLAHRYGLRQIASIEELPGTGMTIAQTAKITALIKEKNIKYIAIETAFSDQGLDKIKQQTGVQTITLQPLETYDNPNDTYEQLMRKNLEALKTALGT
jgi:zinc transport system substrate-binding protein